MDVLFDCGQSLNPAVDIGQVEGGIVTALGAFGAEPFDVVCLFFVFVFVFFVFFFTFNKS